MDDFKEDNDSSEEEAPNDQGQYVTILGEKIRQGKLREGHALEFFVMKEAEELAKKRIKREKKQDQHKAYRDLLAQSGYINEKAVNVLVAESK